MKSSPHMPARLVIVDKDAKYAEWLRNHVGVLYSDANVRVMTPDQFDVARETLRRRNLLLVVVGPGRRRDRLAVERVLTRTAAVPP